MLREYINGKIRENEELAINLEDDIKKQKNREKELKKLIRIIEDENNDGSEIFSPRNHREQNLDKLKQYHEEIERISQETKEKLYKLEQAKKKKAEYESMLAEAEKNHLEEEKSYSDNNAPADEQETEQVEKEECKTDTKRILQKSIEELVKRIEAEEPEKSAGDSSQNYEMEQKNGGEESIYEQDDESKNRPTENDLNGVEIKSAELIVLESERRKEKEFLEKVKKGIDQCFVYSGSKNKCKNELRKVRRMIEDYISSIEMQNK